MEAALAFLGGPFLSSLYEWMFGKVESFLQHKFNRQSETQETVHAREQLEEWRSLLPKIQAMLEQAERQETAHASVQTWHSDLKQLAYDMEDVLDEFQFEVETAKWQSQAEDSTSRPSKRLRLSGLSGSESLPLDLGALLPKINDITTKLQRIERKTKFVELIQQNLSLPQSSTTGTRRPASTSLPEPHVYGREEDRRAILDLVLREEHHEHGVGVIPIVGMGGLGKTTLAQLVYNDEKVKTQFHLRAWASVSEPFDVLKVTKAIVEALVPELLKDHDVNDLNLLQTKLKGALAGNKFLLVLDDVWNEDYGLWDILRKPFLEGATGSKIIVTTRNHGVASIMTMGGIWPYTLNTLPDNECLRLFSQHALQAENFDTYPHLKPMANEIVRRCKGLPLAAKTLGGLLRGKLNRQSWENILNSRIWDLPSEKSDILPALRLSYYHLPLQLKRCFTYCAIFPKDYEFDKDELVLLWMAEGFLKQSNEEKLMEKLGREYFDELLSKSFFQPSNVDMSGYVMHDLIHDLAQSVAGNICSHLPAGMNGDELQVTYNVRHFSVGYHAYEEFVKYRKFEVLNKVKGLRTFVGTLYSKSSAIYIYLSNRVLDELLPELKCLKVLSLRGYQIPNVPDGIRGMKHLRHLDLSFTQIHSLPEFITHLIFLQTLLLECCSCLTKLPNGIGNLINLSHLDISNTDFLKVMPLGIHKLTSLQTLSKFVVSKTGGLALRHLKDLSNLQGRLSIENLENVEDIQDAKEADLEKKKGLKQLSLEWTSEDSEPFITSPRNENNDNRVLNHLQPHQHLEKLIIAGYCGIKFSCWMGHLSSFSRLSYMELRNCRKWGLLPSVGRLPSLKELIITGLEAVQVVGVEFYGNDDVSGESFPALEKLKFQNMRAWEVWSSDNGSGDECAQRFPKLGELMISDCPELKGELPSCLPALRKLTIKGCPQLTASMESLPLLEELDINGCRAVVFMNMVHLTSLTKLRMRDVVEQVRGPVGAFTQAAEALREVYVDINCLNLVIDGNGKMMEMMHLENFVISNFGGPHLESFPEAELPPTVKQLRIEYPNSKCFLYQLLTRKARCLKMLRIEGCKRLESFPFRNFAATLESIEIIDCSDLRFLRGGIRGDDHNRVPAALKKLKISGCESLESFPKRIPRTLEHVCIQDCPNLEIPTSMWLLNLSRLGHLDIRGLDCWESFSVNAMSFPNLKRLEIYNCENLKSLPNALNKLGFLEVLVIIKCPSIETFPEGGLPPNLLRLRVNCENMKQPITKWGLDKLHSLKFFCIHYICPPDGLLPSSLKSFGMYQVKELRSISRDLLRNLTTLVNLVLGDCPKLSYFPEGLYLPPTLEKFQIRGCPHLEDNCRHGGKYWNLLTDIPRLEILPQQWSKGSACLC